MDYQNRVGHKCGSGGPATDQEVAFDRRERLRKLALETIDLSKDPYFLRNHLGSYECKLCLTLHTNEGSYLAHAREETSNQSGKTSGEGEAGCHHSTTAANLSWT
jgi:splicing factor 3A subunit 2